MELKKKRVLSVVISLVGIIATLGGFAVIGLLNVFTDGGSGAITFMSQINKVIDLFENMGSASDMAAYMSGLVYPAAILVIYLFVFLFGLIYIIKLIADLATIGKNNGEQKIAGGLLRLSTPLLFFFGFMIFLNYIKAALGTSTPEMGSYIGLGIGALVALLAGCQYILASEKPMLNKVLRACLAVVSMAGAVFVLTPTIVYMTNTTTPLRVPIGAIIALMKGDTPSVDTYSLYTFTGMTTLFVVAAVLASIVGFLGLDLKSKKVPLIVIAAVALILVAGSVYGAPVLLNGVSTADMSVTLYAHVATGLFGLALILAILVVALSRKENAQAKPAEEVKEEAVPVEEKPAEESSEEPAKAEESVEEETPVAPLEEAPEEKVEEAPAEEKEGQAEAIQEEKVEEPVEEKPLEEEPKEETPAEEEPKEEAPVEEEPVKEEAAPVNEKPAKKAAPKKEEPALKEEKKPAAKKAKAEEPKKEEKKPVKKVAEEKEPAKKSNASYHISKRAKDNKWQVFRAGSDKVIKLFDTKVEAEEYTKRMAENQGVGYLSHASKGKNKGRIQKK